MGAGVEQQALRSPGTQAVGPVTGAEGLREMGPLPALPAPHFPIRLSWGRGADLGDRHVPFLLKLQSLTDYISRMELAAPLRCG